MTSDGLAREQLAHLAEPRRPAWAGSRRASRARSSRSVRAQVARLRTRGRRGTPAPPPCGPPPRPCRTRRSRLEPLLGVAAEDEAPAVDLVHGRHPTSTWTGRRRRGARRREPRPPGAAATSPSSASRTQQAGRARSSRAAGATDEAMRSVSTRRHGGEGQPQLGQVLDEGLLVPRPQPRVEPGHQLRGSATPPRAPSAAGRRGSRPPPRAAPCRTDGPATAPASAGVVEPAGGVGEPGGGTAHERGRRDGRGVARPAARTAPRRGSSPALPTSSSRSRISASRSRAGLALLALQLAAQVDRPGVRRREQVRAARPAAAPRAARATPTSRPSCVGRRGHRVERRVATDPGPDQPAGPASARSCRPSTQAWASSATAASALRRSPDSLVLATQRSRTGRATASRQRRAEHRRLDQRALGGGRPAGSPTAPAAAPGPCRGRSRGRPCVLGERHAEQRQAVQQPAGHAVRRVAVDVEVGGLRARCASTCSRWARSRASVSATSGGVPAPGRHARPSAVAGEHARAAADSTSRPRRRPRPCTRQLVTASSRSLRSGAGRSRSSASSRACPWAAATVGGRHAACGAGAAARAAMSSRPSGRPRRARLAGVAPAAQVLPQPLVPRRARSCPAA